MLRVHIAVFGSVQGVGFRPFVFRLARTHGLVGEIINSNNGVRIDVQGTPASIAHFQHDLVATMPPRARIDEITTEEAPLHACTTFTIGKSSSFEEKALALLPDTALCDACLKELHDPTNRRYRYPFVHCMTCGPRFSLFFGMPYDRHNTTMIDFTMCPACQDEYNNPDNRRFYAQTNCCPTCGPTLSLQNPHQETVAPALNALTATARALLDGKIIALKNTGGYLLLVDATNEEAVVRLRSRKRRPKKPFALMMPTLESIEAIAHLEPAAQETLTSPASPIVLLRKKENSSLLAPSVAPGSPYYGVMLPHSALHLLLFESINRPLIATSGNISGAPLCITEEEAFAQLGSIADLFLIHNRRIHNRLDDSIVQIIHGRPTLLRRARGYIPFAIKTEHTSPSLFAAGGHLKNTFAWHHNKKIYPGQHIGDLESKPACTSYAEEVEKWKELLGITLDSTVCDSHSDYFSTHYTEEQKLPSESIQHHKAHLFSGMADQALTPPLLALSWDGTGYGDDGTIWGGEAFVVHEGSIERIASLRPFPLPGGEVAIREPRRSALGLLHALPDSFKAWKASAFTEEELRLLTHALDKGINAPVCSSAGRLFDAVSALLGCCLRSQFEGDAALSLEALATTASEAPSYPLPLSQNTLDWRPLIESIATDLRNGVPRAHIARGFHEALARSIVTIARSAALEHVLLTGGVMQNRLLIERTITLLEESGFKPHWHQHIPPNDGGLAVGQIYGSLCMQQWRQHVPCPTR